MDVCNAGTAQFQDRGALLCIDASLERFSFATRNANSLLGRSADAPWNGAAVVEVFERKLVHAVRNGVGSQSLKERRRYLGAFRCKDRLFDAELFAVGERLVLEVVPACDDPIPGVFEVLQDYEVLSDAVISMSEGSGFFERVVSLLRVMSGYHCVAVDRIADCDITVVAVSGKSNLAESQVDSPKQLRAIRDVSGSTTGFEPSDVPPYSDFGLSGLSTPNPQLLTALCDLGVGGCASLGIWRDSELWGRLKFLHSQPRLPNRRTRIALELLGPLIGQRLLNLH